MQILPSQWEEGGKSASCLRKASCCKSGRQKFIMDAGSYQFMANAWDTMQLSFRNLYRGRSDKITRAMGPWMPGRGTFSTSVCLLYILEQGEKGQKYQIWNLKVWAGVLEVVEGKRIFVSFEIIQHLFSHIPQVPFPRGVDINLT